MGVVRADLQLTALEIVRDVQFLMPRDANGRWVEAIPKLADWLATPAIANLACARRLTRQLAEDISETKIVRALEAGEADIVMDPQDVTPNQTVRLGVRFRELKLNGAAARAAVRVVWHFDEPEMAVFAARTSQFWPRVTKLFHWIGDHLALRAIR